MANKTTKFLDYILVHCTNGDGIVLRKEKGKPYETHLGNFGSVDDAQIAATLHFMIARPDDFSRQVAMRLLGYGGTMSEYFIFKRVLEREGIRMPKEIEAGDGINLLICYNGEPVGTRKNKSN